MEYFPYAVAGVSIINVILLSLFITFLVLYLTKKQQKLYINPNPVQYSSIGVSKFGYSNVTAFPFNGASCSIVDWTEPSGIRYYELNLPSPTSISLVAFTNLSGTESTYRFNSATMGIFSTNSGMNTTAIGTYQNVRGGSEGYWVGLTTTNEAFISSFSNQLAFYTTIPNEQNDSGEQILLCWR